MNHFDPSSLISTPVVLRRTLPSIVVARYNPLLNLHSLLLRVSLVRQRVQYNRSDSKSCILITKPHRENRSRIVLGKILLTVVYFYGCIGCCSWNCSKMSLVFFFFQRHPMTQSFRPKSSSTLATQSFHFLPCRSPRKAFRRYSNDIFLSEPIRWRTSRLLVTKSSSSSSSSTMSNDGEMLSGTTLVSKPKNRKSSSPNKSTKRTISTTTVVTDATAATVPLIDEEVMDEYDLDLVSSIPSTSTNATTTKEATKNKKALDAVNHTTVGTTTSSSSVAKSRPVKATKKAVQPKPSAPSYFKMDDRHSTELSNRGHNETTASLLESSKSSSSSSEELIVGSNDAGNISCITPNSLLPYTMPMGMPTMMMMSSYASTYMNTTGLSMNENATAPCDSNTTTSALNRSSSSSSISATSTSSPEYIVISRTPIPTTSMDNDTASNTTSCANDANNSILTSPEDVLLNPYDLIPPNATTGEWRIPYPKALSPSSIKEFQACPQSFLFQYILGLRQPTTTVLAKGTMCHAALERIFDIEPHDRSLSVLQNLFRTAWAEQRTSDTYRILFEEDVLVDQLQAEEGGNNDDGSSGNHLPTMQPMMERRRYIQKEKTWGQEGLALLENYWLAEDASSILRPNPVQREVWVKSNLPLILQADQDSLSTSSNVAGTATTIRPITSNVTTSATNNHVDGDNGNIDSTVPPISMFLDNSSDIPSIIAPAIDTGDDDSTDEADHTIAPAAATNFDSANITKFLVRGIVDRLDMVQDPNNKTQISLRLIDYKSGKAPDLKYSPSMNLKIQNEAFDQLLIYALLLREANRNKVNPMPLRYLRLFYLTSIHDQKAIYWDMDLGATQEERDAILHTVHVSLSNVYRNICQIIDQQNFLAFPGCQRSFCYCHKCRPKFAPGTVWQPPH